MKTLKFKITSSRAPMSRWPACLLVAAGMQTLGLPALHAATTNQEITDSGITSAVEAGLAEARGVALNGVDVTTSQGVVTLSGSVENLLDQVRAQKTAEGIRGVLDVTDKITVNPASLPDEDIRKNIQAALQQDPATDSYQTTVAVQDGVATLTGSLASYAEKQLVSRVAEGVKGVKEVRNQINITYQSQRTDADIDADLKSVLQWGDIWVNGDLITPVVKDGQVTLTGTIGSKISKSRAYDDAWVNGVTSVDDSGLKVDPGVHNGALQNLNTSVRPDADIRQSVQAALKSDPRVSAFSPEITVVDGTVTLRGTVGNPKAETSAKQDAKNVVGVRLVESHLKVRSSDATVATDTQNQLKAALAWDPWLDDSPTIDVAVINRVAYLSGGVDSSFQKAEAQDVASRTKGVLEVRNHLKVVPDFTAADYYDDYGYYSDYDYGYYGWPYYSASPYYNESPDYVYNVSGPQAYKTDAQIKKSIEDRMFWSPFVDRSDVKVAVDGGVATLTGSIGTWVGWGEAENDAHKGGASFVRDRVKVD